MHPNSTCAKRRRLVPLCAALLCAASALVASVSNAQSAGEPGAQRVSAVPALAASGGPAAARQASVAAVPEAGGPSAAGTDLYAEERPQPATMVALVAAGILVVLLVTAGVLLIVRGLRDDLRDRKRGYRRRSRRIAERSPRPPVAPAG